MKDIKASESAALSVVVCKSQDDHIRALNQQNWGPWKNKHTNKQTNTYIIYIHTSVSYSFEIRKSGEKQNIR